MPGVEEEIGYSDFGRRAKYSDVKWFWFCKEEQKKIN